ncbi:MAG: DUF1295 domain-containing protein [Deltaproteobacteria bacterium]|nr:DUF1295 domain-containing protein [Deltaproteobacteria bacterium]
MMRAALLCIGVYLIALGSAGAVVWLTGPSLGPIWAAFVADIVATLLVFGASLRFRNSSLYDPYWSVAPPLIAGYFWLCGERPLQARQVALFALVLIWALRLTYNWASQWRGLAHEDWRYIELQKKHGRAYWLVSFAGIHLMPTLVVFFACLSLFPALQRGGPRLGGLDLVGLALTTLGIALETVADFQLRRFVRSRRSAELLLERGLWALVRHPNYLGELCFWWGLFVVGYGVAPSYARYALAGQLAITVMFVVVSVPMIERRLAAGKPQFADYRRRVPALLPWRGIVRRGLARRG